MMVLPIAASEFDVIIGIIAFVGWILAQVLSRKQKGKTETPPPLSTPEGNGAPTSPQDEMRKFFEEIEQTLNPQSAPPPLPEPVLPRPLTEMQKPPRQAPIAKPIVTYTVKSTVQVPVYPEPVAAQLTPPATPIDGETAARQITSGELRVQNIRREFEDPAALRKMIVASEILGKPVGLRARGMSA